MRLVYYDRASNFGDALNLDLLKFMGVKNVKRTWRRWDGICIGSILGVLTCGRLQWRKRCEKYFFPRVKVWGTGFMHAQGYESEYLRRDVEVYAVRGKLSLERLKNAVGNKKIVGGDNWNDVCVGDPGLLVREMFDADSVIKKYDLGVVPHMRDKNSRLLDKIRVGKAKIKILDIQAKPYDFLDELASCRRVISSLLHGLIAADALGIPNVRMRLTDGYSTGNSDYKYRDYYSAFGLNKYNCVDLRERDFGESDLAKLGCVASDKLDEICRKLKAAFPF